MVLCIHRYGHRKTTLKHGNIKTKRLDLKIATVDQLAK